MKTDGIGSQGPWIEYKRLPAYLVLMIRAKILQEAKGFLVLGLEKEIRKSKQ